MEENSNKKDAPLLAIIALVLSLLGVFTGSFGLLIVAFVCSILSEKHLYARIAFIISIVYMIFLVFVFLGVFTLLMIH